MRWQLLIPHMPHRHRELVELLERLAPQAMPGFEVVVFTDNLQLSYAEKLQTLYSVADADYVSSLGNDDLPHPEFVPRIMAALGGDPDYVGFRVRFTQDGMLQPVVIHSLRCPGWVDGNPIQRDFTYFNPIRLELARRVRFTPPYCDREWGDDMRALGLELREVFLDFDAYEYRRRGGDNFHTHRSPLPADEIPPLPKLPFVRHIVHGL